jgi:hypothetical protein
MGAKRSPRMHSESAQQSQESSQRESVCECEILSVNLESVQHNTRPECTPNLYKALRDYTQNSCEARTMPERTQNPRETLRMHSEAVRRIEKQCENPQNTRKHSKTTQNRYPCETLGNRGKTIRTRSESTGNQYKHTRNPLRIRATHSKSRFGSSNTHIHTQNRRQTQKIHSETVRSAQNACQKLNIHLASTQNAQNALRFRAKHSESIQNASVHPQMH